MGEPHFAFVQKLAEVTCVNDADWRDFSSSLLPTIPLPLRNAGRDVLTTRGRTPADRARGAVMPPGQDAFSEPHVWLMRF